MSSDYSQITCILCEKPAYPWMTIGMDPKTELVCHHELYKCSNCSFGMVFPRPHPDVISSFYKLPKYYTHGESHLADSGPVSLTDKIRFHLAWRLDFSETFSAKVDQILKNRPSEICDLGCGDGTLGVSLNHLGHRVIGVEFDKDAVQLARKNGLEVYEGSVDQIPEIVASKQFDAVILSQVLEHLLDPVATVKTVYSLLRKGGVFICRVPNMECLNAYYRGITWEHLDPPRHLNFFTPSNLKNICQKAGFSIHRIFFDNYCRQFHNSFINTESKIYDAYVRNGIIPAKSQRNSKLNAWKLLARSAFRNPSRKYDVVGIVAKKI